MIPFELDEPDSVAAAVELLDPDDPTVRPLAGGTALMLMLKAGVYQPARLVSLRRLAPAHGGIAAGPDGLRIGALCTLAALERADAVRRQAPVITAALRTLANVRVRNVATLGGHLAHADPHMDLPPVLIALRARVSIAGPAGLRELPVEQLVTGYYETVLAPNELIVSVHVPAPAAAGAAYLKCTTRAVHDWPALGVAVALGADGDARVVVSAVGSRPLRLATAEGCLRAGYDDAALANAAEAAAVAVDPGTDARGSAAYKRELVRVYVARALRQARAGPGRGLPA